MKSLRTTVQGCLLNGRITGANWILRMRIATELLRKERIEVKNEKPTRQPFRKRTKSRRTSVAHRRAVVMFFLKRRRRVYAPKTVVVCTISPANVVGAQLKRGIKHGVRVIAPDI